MDSLDSRLSIDALEEIESVCQEFEALCRDDQEAAQAGDFLDRVDGRVAKCQLLFELILLKADYQLRVGRWPDRADYLKTLPEWSEPIERAFARIAGTVHSDDATPNLGPRYRVCELLGTGGMGRVYRARDQKLDRDVAVKVLKAGGATLGKRFETEIRLVASLAHPNVVSLFDFSSYRGVDFAVMELVVGETLRTRLEQSGGMGVGGEQAIEWALGVAKALHAAHRLGVVHRDIKPENVMVSRDGQVKVLDFGLALHEFVPSDERLTADSGAVGTLPYMSPEQAANRQLTCASDIFSLGTVLIELLTGDNPFRGPSHADTLRNITEKRNTVLDDWSNSAGPVLQEMVGRMLSKDAASRPTADAVAERLAAIERGSIHPSDAWIPLSPAATRDTAIPTNIPLRSKELIGRTEQLADLAERLEEPSLTSVVGPGGCGKTTLALQVARESLRNFPGGAWVCELASLQPDGDVAQALIATLDKAEGNLGSLDEAVGRLGSSRTLIVLDNCEHVIDAAAELASELLDRLPALSILVTSRRPLDLAEEHVYFLDGLDLRGENSDAARLLIRCGKKRAGYEHNCRDDSAIAAVARRLEGLPLLLELAAPKLKSMSVTELLESLENQPATLQSQRSSADRQATVGQAIEWSYDLLDAEQQAQLLALSTFRASFTAEAAEAVAEAADGRRWLSRLVDQSVVVRIRADGESRYRLLEPIRQFCHGRIDQETLASHRERHAWYFCNRMGELGVQSYGDEETDATKRLNLEWADLRAAVLWGQESKVPEIAIDSITRLGWTVMLQYRAEAFRWLEQAEDHMPEALGERLDALAIIGMGHWLTGQQTLAQRYADRSNAIRPNSYAYTVAHAVSYNAGRFEEAAALFRRGRELALSQEDESNHLFMWVPLDALSLTRADPKDPEIDRALEASRAIIYQSRWPTGIAWHTMLAGHIAGFRGETAIERELLERAFELAMLSGALWLQAYAKMSLEAHDRGKPGHERLRECIDRFRVFVDSNLVAHYPVGLRSLVAAMIDVGLDELAARCTPLTTKLAGPGSDNEHHPGFPKLVAELEERLGKARFSSLRLQGDTLTVEDVVAMALTAADGLGAAD